jgi:hypothetical protein
MNEPKCWRLRYIDTPFPPLRVPELFRGLVVDWSFPILLLFQTNGGISFRPNSRSVLLDVCGTRMKRM